MSGWIGVEVEWVLSLVSHLPKPWPREVVLMYLRYVHRQIRRGKPFQVPGQRRLLTKFPSRPFLQRLFGSSEEYEDGWSEWSTRSLLKDPEWEDTLAIAEPSDPPVALRGGSCRTPERLQSEDRKHLKSHEKDTQNPPARLPMSYQVPPHAGRSRSQKEERDHSIPLPPSPDVEGGEAEADFSQVLIHFGLNGNQVRALTAAGLSNIEALTAWSSTELLRLNGLGRRGLEAIERGLARMGLKLKEVLACSEEGEGDWPGDSPPVEIPRPTFGMLVSLLEPGKIAALSANGVDSLAALQALPPDVLEELIGQSGVSRIRILLKQTAVEPESVRAERRQR